LPTYEWKCKSCGEVVDVQRTVAERDIPPTMEEAGKVHEQGMEDSNWKRIITATPVMWEDARDKGVFDRHYRWPT